MSDEREKTATGGVVAPGMMTMMMIATMIVTATITNANDVVVTTMRVITMTANDLRSTRTETDE